MKWCEIRPGLEVSVDGRVRHNGRDLKPQRAGKGYLAVKPMRDGVRKSFYVHRLVCEAFHGPQPPDHEVDHINRVRDSNHARNLEWVTSTENKRRAGIQPPTMYGVRNGKATITPAKVRRIRRLRAKGCAHSTIAAKIPCSIGIVRNVLYGRHWTHV